MLVCVKSKCTLQVRGSPDNRPTNEYALVTVSDVTRELGRTLSPRPSRHRLRILPQALLRGLRSLLLIPVDKSLLRWLLVLVRLVVPGHPAAGSAQVPHRDAQHRRCRPLPYRSFLWHRASTCFWNTSADRFCLDRSPNAWPFSGRRFQQYGPCAGTWSRLVR